VIPTALQQTIERVHGEAGRRWLATLPALVNELGERWSLTLAQPFANLSYNLVIPGRCADGKEVVLKLGVPCPELFTEAEALRVFRGKGAVNLFADDARRGALLMERVSPGTCLHESLTDPAATQAAAELMRKLWHIPPAEHHLPDLNTWFRSLRRLRETYKGETGPFEKKLIMQAEEVFAELQLQPSRSMVLHGDLHHTNILFSAQRGWLAIDPKGLVGDPGYEVGPFMLNQLRAGASDSEIVEVLASRLAVFSTELHIEQKRLTKWAFCHAVLSAVWSFEDGEDWTRTIELAELLQRLI
jgi:streptomycin 6-kinase